MSQIIELKNNGYSPRRIAVIVGISERQVKKIVQEAKLEGLVLDTHKTTYNRPTAYKVTIKAQRIPVMERVKEGLRKLQGERI
jgi:transposase